MTTQNGPELVIGLVTPIGTDTSELAREISGLLSLYDYVPVVIKLSELLPHVAAPLGESEDVRVKRLIAAGDQFCRAHSSVDNPGGDPAALARLAVDKIRRTRVALMRQDGVTEPASDLVLGRARTAYVLHSLKRPAEVQLLRRIYDQQFVLLGSQGTVQQRRENLLKRPIAAASDSARKNIVDELMRLDADESDPVGQQVNEAYPLSDFFLRDNEAQRIIKLLFGEPIAPDIDEYAMYVARASRARSLAASRKVGAAIVVRDAVISTGYNDVPHGQTPDVIEGRDTGKRLRQESVFDTVTRLKDKGMLSRSASHLNDERLTSLALEALGGGQLLSVIEYQRAVHAEARAIDDATIRGVSPAGGILFVTTYPCHLCYKHALSVHIQQIRYIEPYPKSKAAEMYPEGSEQRLIPYAGVAPRRFIQVFDDRPAFEADSAGHFKRVPPESASPLVGQVRQDAVRDAEERVAVNGLLEDYR